MCGGGPKPTDPPPPRQAARAPDPANMAGRVADEQKRRMGFAASILTPAQLGLTPAATTGKSLLGA